MHKVSIIITVYNEEKNIKEAVDSLLNQTYNDFEIIIVNDASTDTTGKILGSYCDPRIYVINNKDNKGPSISRNDAIKVASGEYIAIMDADDISLPQRLERQVQFLNEQKDVGVVGSAYLCIDQDGNNLYPIYYPQDNESIKQRLINDNCFSHSSIMYRKSVYQETGGYRAEFELSEDYDLFLRMSEITNMHNLPEILCKNRWSPYSLSISQNRRLKQYGELARVLALKRRAQQKEDLETTMASIVYRTNVANITREKISSFLVLSKYYYGTGCFFLNRGENKKAKLFFLRCLRYNLFNLKGVLGLCLSFFPSKLYNFFISKEK